MNIAAEIRELEELRAIGTLTEDEFQQAKQRVLSGESPYDPPDNAAYRTSEQYAPVYSHRICGVDEMTWCTLLHLSPLLTYAGGIGLVVPIVMWAVGKEESELARAHGARMMNWMISSVIYGIITGILCLFIIGIPMLVMLVVLTVIFPVVAAIKCGRNELWSYPLAIRFLDETYYEDPQYYDTANQTFQ